MILTPPIIQGREIIFFACFKQKNNIVNILDLTFTFGGVIMLLALGKREC